MIALFAVPGLLAGDMSPLPRLVAALGVAVFGVAFVVVSSRIVGLIGVSSNPTSGMTLVTLLGVAVVFVALGWSDPSARAAILTVGTVVCIAASKAGDISQDLKTGYLVGATPARQQLGQFIGAAFACWAVAGTVLLLGRAYTFGSPELPAPQATLMKTVIEGVLAGALPWGLVGTGAALSLSRDAGRAARARLRRRHLPAAGHADADLRRAASCGAWSRRGARATRRRRIPACSPRRA